jgi:hypothetical protein
VRVLTSDCERFRSNFCARGIVIDEQRACLTDRLVEVFIGTAPADHRLDRAKHRVFAMQKLRFTRPEIAHYDFLCLRHCRFYVGVVYAGWKHGGAIPGSRWQSVYYGLWSWHIRSTALAL